MDRRLKPPRAISLGQLKGTFILEGPVNDCRTDWAGLVPTGVASDSRDVRAGDLFVAGPGSRAHGAAFVPSAVQGGAVAVLTDRSGLDVLGDVHVPVLVKEDVGPLAAPIAAAIWGQPAEHLRTVAVTGTHGVATTANMVHRLFVSSGVHAVEVVSERLTAPQLHRLLASDPGATDAVLALPANALRRGAGIGLRPDVVAVAALHDPRPQVLVSLASEVRVLLAAARHRVILLDSDTSAHLADEFPDAVLVALATSPHAHRATWRVTGVGADGAASAFTLEGPAGVRHTTTVGRPGTLLLADAALAVVTSLATGTVDPDLTPGVPVDIPHRMEVLRRRPAVVMDLAATAGELRRVLGSLPHRGRVWCVYPAAAPLERAGRLGVAQALSDSADRIVLAAAPDGAAALSALRSCFTPSEAGRVHEAVSVDAAISFARLHARPEDVVLVAGCGTILRGDGLREGHS
ncbi:MAG: glutamate ligase domain-containing protein [Actinomycetota bacterium]